MAGFQGDAAPMADALPWLPEDIAQPARPNIVNVPGSRTPDALRAVVAQFQVELHPRYRARDIDGNGTIETCCNVFLSDVTAALSCPVPRRIGAAWIRANDQYLWLSTQVGIDNGWIPGDMAIAGLRVDAGRPTVAAWRSMTGGPGHVALVVPPPKGRMGLWVAQAGAVNSECMPLRAAFGARPVSFYSHK